MIESTRFKRIHRKVFSRHRRGLLRLWSFQPFEVWQLLQVNKILYVEPKYIDVDFVEPYQWMQHQMAKRLPDYIGHSPWWAYNGQKPDLRSWRRYFPNGHGVCLQLQLPAERVLLSDYETWHYVLSRSYLPLNKEEYEMNIEPFETWPPADYWKNDTIRSWERVFELELLRANNLWPIDHIQACFERLDIADVIAVEELQAR